MKIGIITLPLHTNYGGLLQNYALQQVIMQQGHSVETIDYGRWPSSPSYSFELLLKFHLSNIKRCLSLFFFPKREKRTSLRPNEEELLIIRKNTNYFINKYLSLSKQIVTASDFKEISNSKRYDAYVVGSDQCWRPIYNTIFLKERFLRFAKKQEGVKRIAYGVSFGTDKWEMDNRLTKECSYLAKKFDVVTVREESGIELCKKYLGVESTKVIDPTMLLDKEDYMNLINDEHEPKSPGNLFYYILDPTEDKAELINEVAARTMLIPFKVMPHILTNYLTREDLSQHINDFVFPTVTSWLRAFYDAEMVIVDSFHGMIFSIIFNKPFWVLGNNFRGNARFESLLKHFGLEDRMITISNMSSIDWNKPIEWKRVNELRQKEKERCIKFLEEALS